jgi:hypothetical protein
MNAELKQALEVIKKHCDTPKGKSFYEYMEAASLKQRIESLKSNFLHYVDHQTIWYLHTQLRKIEPDHFKDHPNRIDVELSKKQREDCIDSLQWFKKDIEACINHLKK